MKIFLILPGGETRWDIDIPGDGEPTALVPGKACPECKATPFRVCGRGKHPSEDDRAYEAQGVCCGCGKHVGRIRAEVDTIFGVQEDERVMNGPWKVVI